MPDDNINVSSTPEADIEALFNKTDLNEKSSSDVDTSHEIGSSMETGVKPSETVSKSVKKKESNTAFIVSLCILGAMSINCGIAAYSYANYGHILIPTIMLVNGITGRQVGWDGITVSSHYDIGTADKPVIYVYNDTDIPDLSLSVLVNNAIPDISYPVLDETSSWHLSVDADSNINVDGRAYNYLYWETQAAFGFNIDSGFCVRGEDTIDFLESALSDLGLTDKEQNDFITYWLPRMQDNEYNIIQFNPDEYFEACKHICNRTVDNEIYAYMLWQPSQEYIELEEQDLTAMNNKERTGLTIVEWGGTELKGSVSNG